MCSFQFFVHDHQEPGYLCPPVTVFGELPGRRCQSSKLPLLPWHLGMSLSIAIYSILVSLMFPDGRSAAKLWAWVGQLKATGCLLLEDTADRVTCVQNRVSPSPHQVQENVHAPLRHTVKTTRHCPTPRPLPHRHTLTFHR